MYAKYNFVFLVEMVLGSLWNQPGLLIPLEKKLRLCTTVERCGLWSTPSLDSSPLSLLPCLIMLGNYESNLPGTITETSPLISSKKSWSGQENIMNLTSAHDVCFFYPF
jgi:hypothetical protein